MKRRHPARVGECFLSFYGPFAVGVAVTSEIASRPSWITSVHVAMLNFCAIVGCSNRADRDKSKSVLGCQVLLAIMVRKPFS